MKSIISDERRFKENRGTGEGVRYIPWVQTTDFSSLGLKWRIPGVKIDRLHHFVSILEERVFYIVEAMPNIVDIREQFPLLPLNETVSIAKSIQVLHPRDRGKFSVRSTDFLLTTKSGFVAICVKYKIDLRKKKVREKIAIEEIFWKKKGVKFLVITEEDITRFGYRNAERMRSFAKRPTCQTSDREFLNVISKYKSDEHLPVKELFSIMTDELREPYALIHKLFLHLVFKQLIRFDYNCGYAFNLKLKDISL